MYSSQKDICPFGRNRTLQNRTVEHNSKYLTKLCTFLKCHRTVNLAKNHQKILSVHTAEVCSSAWKIPKARNAFLDWYLIFQQDKSQWGPYESTWATVIPKPNLT